MYYLIWRFLPLDSCSSSGDGCGSRFLSLPLDRPNPTRLHLSLSACVRPPMCRRLLCELTSSQNEPTTRATTKPREPKTAFISEARLACYFAWRAVVWRVICYLAPASWNRCLYSMWVAALQHTVTQHVRDPNTSLPTSRRCCMSNMTPPQDCRRLTCAREKKKKNSSGHQPRRYQIQKFKIHYFRKYSQQEWRTARE